MDNEKAWFVRRIVLSVLFLVIVAVPLYPELYGLDELTPFTQLVAFRPQGLVIVFAVALLMLIRKSWRIAAALVAVLTLTGAGLTLPRVTSDPEPPAADTRVLTIMVANVLGGGAKAGAVAELIREHKPDLVSLPEAQVDVREEIRAQVEGYTGYTEQPTKAVESATSVLVAGSLGAVQVRPDLPTSFGNLMITGGNLGQLRLVAYHGFPPLPEDVPPWKHDLTQVRRWCAQDPPTIVAGDFNATLDHADFRWALASNCHSVGPSVGGGLKGTWPSDQPAIARTQIDHVLATRTIRPLKFATYEVEGTDHLAVIATVAVPKDG
ncbi:endonuclease/exonuclease/phosphatase family protein [Kribbella antibiotica]|uniref:endonuclease/exonuclease/phosphatase family protein n=1 Tax=Kribbella antibiotica TaxID=190195 RepID=UPI001EDDCE30|nr:endonuclease/exonuclease/phosphatase family protein [Kribbella antibiotica]